MTGFDWDRHRRREKRRQRDREGRLGPPVAMERVPPGVTGFRGVHLQKDKGLFRAAIEVRGKRLHLGYFRDAASAAQAYDREAFRAWGDRAVLNFAGTEISS